MEGVRRLIDEHPKAAPNRPTSATTCAGLCVSGRFHFFDNAAERRNALGLPPKFVEAALNEFNEDQISQYFQRTGRTGFLPQWLPTRPLLVAYLAATGMLGTLGRASDEDESDPATGWDILLAEIAAREAANCSGDRWPNRPQNTRAPSYDSASIRGGSWAPDSR